MEAANLITLDSIIRGAIYDQGYDTLHKYPKYLKWGIEFVEDFHRTGGVAPKTVKIKVNPNKTVDLPYDCEKVTKIGLMKGDRLVAFVPDETIGSRQTSPPENNAEYIDVVGGDREQFVYNFINFYNSGYVYDIQGYGSRHNGWGYFRVMGDKIQLESFVTAQYVYVEYLSNGFDPCTRTMVPNYARLEIANGIYWYDKRFKLGDSSSETQWAKKEYQEAVQQRRALTSNFSYAGLVDALTRRTQIVLK